MEILIGLVIGTIAVIGWAYGNLFVCIFLSLATLFAALVMNSLSPSIGVWSGVAVFLIVIWTPLMVRSSYRR
jgi:hypothetical protein